MINSKKGFLLGEETLKIIIAVICIIFLVYLLASLYYNSVRDKNADLAKASVKYIIDEINSGKTEIQIYNPEGWKILNFKGNLCICKDVDECDPDDTCVKSEVVVNEVIVIKSPPIILQLNDNILSKK